MLRRTLKQARHARGATCVVFIKSSSESGVFSKSRLAGPAIVKSGIGGTARILPPACARASLMPLHKRTMRRNNMRERPRAVLSFSGARWQAVRQALEAVRKAPTLQNLCALSILLQRFELSAVDDASSAATAGSPTRQPATRRARRCEASPADHDLRRLAVLNRRSGARR